MSLTKNSDCIEMRDDRADKSQVSIAMEVPALVLPSDTDAMFEELADYFANISRSTIALAACARSPFVAGELKGWAEQFANAESALRHPNPFRQQKRRSALQLAMDHIDSLRYEMDFIADNAKSDVSQTEIENARKSSVNLATASEALFIGLALEAIPSDFGGSDSGRINENAPFWWVPVVRDLAQQIVSDRSTADRAKVFMPHIESVGYLRSRIEFALAFLPRMLYSEPGVVREPLGDLHAAVTVLIDCQAGRVVGEEASDESAQASGPIRLLRRACGRLGEHASETFQDRITKTRH